jgi:hypothetical protein
MKVLYPFVVPLLVFLSIASSARAEGAPVSESPTTPANGSVVSLPLPDVSVRSTGPVRPLLAHFARQEGLRRYGEGAVGIAGGAVLVGAGFAADKWDSAWSYAFWISGGVVALGSIASFFVPSELERLAQSGTNLSDQQLRAQWGELARTRRLERRAGAVLGALLGATGTVLGGLVLDRKLGEFERDSRRIYGSSLVASGALGLVESAVHWFVPSPIEVGYGVVDSRPALAFAAAPTNNGLVMALAGAF